jgi:hypothetical protein
VNWSYALHAARPCPAASSTSVYQIWLRHPYSTARVHRVRDHARRGAGVPRPAMVRAHRFGSRDPDSDNELRGRVSICAAQCRHGSCPGSGRALRRCGDRRKGTTTPTAFLRAIPVNFAGGARQLSLSLCFPRTWLRQRARGDLDSPRQQRTGRQATYGAAGRR